MAREPHVYRRDIDGLRAIAVIAVVLFHAGIPGFPGGYVGVDVFFVISGYLITSIILEEMQAGTFSVSGFYERRIRRIFPALFAVLAVTAIAGSFILLPYDYKELGQSLASATLFVSNVFFWRTSDYFAGPAHLKPLLHTWSLAVEEQFYIVYPLLLVALRRWVSWALVPALAALAAISLALCVWGTQDRPVMAFYLAPFRAWELLLGALLAAGAVPQLKTRLPCDLLGIAGLGLILWSVATFSTATPFPGTNALAPCVGAALVIYSGAGSETRARRLLSLPAVVFVGLISYSLYLWHWPILVFARHWNGEILAVWQTGVLLAASIGVAVLSWKYVEQPFRSRRFRVRRIELFRTAGAVMASAVAFGALAHTTNGWKRRFDGYQRPAIYGLQKFKDGKCFLLAEQGPWNYAGLEECRTGRSEAPMILVWGDSFAAHLVPGLSSAAGNAVGVLQYTASGCPPVLGIDIANRPFCRAFNDHALRVIGEVEPEVVVLSARWEMYLPRVVGVSDIQATVDRLAPLGVKVIVAGQSPTFDFAHPYDFVFRKGDVPARVSHDLAINAELAGLKGAHLFDPMRVLCSSAGCRLKEGRSYLYFDGGHLSYVGSTRVGDALLEHAKGMFPVTEEEAAADSVAAAQAADGAPGAAVGTLPPAAAAAAP